VDRAGSGRDDGQRARPVGHDVAVTLHEHLDAVDVVRLDDTHLHNGDCAVVLLHGVGLLLSIAARRLDASSATALSGSLLDNDAALSAASSSLDTVSVEWLLLVAALIGHDVLNHRHVVVARRRHDVLDDGRVVVVVRRRHVLHVDRLWRGLHDVQWWQRHHVGRRHGDAPRRRECLRCHRDGLRALDLGSQRRGHRRIFLFFVARLAPLLHGPRHAQHLRLQRVVLLLAHGLRLGHRLFRCFELVVQVRQARIYQRGHGAGVALVVVVDHLINKACGPLGGLVRV
jgi:hypothetical protein